MNRYLKQITLLAAWLVAVNSYADSSWDGSLELEQRYFWQNDAGSISDSENRGQTSLRLQFEIFTDWNDGDDNLVIEPFVRLDEQDSERRHADLRQFLWTHLGENWEFSAGLGHVFWGVTESQHLVDVINQTDSVENIDGEDKLGQPMLRYQYFLDNATLDAFILPYFRTRTFAGINSRLSGGVAINNDHELYESEDGQNNVDFALRYSLTLGDWNIGLSWFDGTAREPDLQRAFDPQTLSITPYYAQTQQFGADVQLTTDAWLVKLEAIKRDFDDGYYEDFSAVTVGTEYTFTGIFGSIYDLGALVEYSWDERKQQATTPFQNDLFLGARLAFNDMSSSEMLFGITQDLDESSSRAVFIEAATRIAPTMTANIELRYFDSDQSNDVFYRFRDDSFIQLGLEYYFD